MNRLQVRDDMGEDVPYTSSHLPIRSVVGRLSNFFMYSADCHWHRDLEFIIILEGEMTYHVNDRTYPLRKGDGIFVNTNRLHFGAADESGSPRECVFLCLLLHPSLICAHPYIENRFVNPLLYDSRFDAPFFPAPAKGERANWRTDVLERIRALAELTMQAPDDSAMEVQSRFYSLISLLFSNTVAPENIAGKNDKTAPCHKVFLITSCISGYGRVSVFLPIKRQASPMWLWLPGFPLSVIMEKFSSVFLV